MWGKSGPFVMSSIRGSAGGTCSHIVDISVADDIKQMNTCVAEVQQDERSIFILWQCQYPCGFKTRFSLVTCTL